MSVDLEEESAKVVVADDQLSLAIGRDGQNVRLAAKLTGWKIDVVSKESGQVEDWGEQVNQEEGEEEQTSEENAEQEQGEQEQPQEVEDTKQEEKFKEQNNEDNS